MSLVYLDPDLARVQSVKGIKHTPALLNETRP